MTESERVDRDIVYQIVVDEKRMNHPYATFDKLVEKLNAIKPYLVEVAREEEYTTYMETAHESGVFTAHQSQVLGTLGLHEDELGNPPLPAVVVQKRDPPRVGEKYFNMIEVARNITDRVPEEESEREARWEEHVRAVRNYWNF